MRCASVQGRLGLLPLTPDSDCSRDLRYRVMYVLREEYSEWRAPDRRNAEPFPMDLPEVGGAVARYPSQIDAEDYYSAADGYDDMRFSDLTAEKNT